VPDSAPAVRRVRWIGPTDGPEFGPCYALAASEASVLAKPSGEVDLTVVACRRPLVTPDAVAELAAAGPVVQLLGVWCEGEGRTGRVVPDAERVFWHAWPAWWRRKTDAAESLAGLIRIDTPDREFAAALLATLGEIGCPAIASRSTRTTAPSVVLWDGAQLDGREADRLDRVCREARRCGAGVVAMLDFPRPETVAAVRAIGATAVLGKPFQRVDLLAALRSAAALATTANQPATDSLTEDSALGAPAAWAA